MTRTGRIDRWSGILPMAAASLSSSGTAADNGLARSDFDGVGNDPDAVSAAHSVVIFGE
jgi:hypothetical protein